jgi:hypothetical protein
MNTVFYSWQSDRPGAVCRNFIERALQSAIDRLRADVEIEPSLRKDLELDKDTKNVPGSRRRRAKVGFDRNFNAEIRAFWGAFSFSTILR